MLTPEHVRSEDYLNDFLSCLMWNRMMQNLFLWLTRRFFDSRSEATSYHLDFFCSLNRLTTVKNTYSKQSWSEVSNKITTKNAIRKFITFPNTDFQLSQRHPCIHYVITRFNASPNRNKQQCWANQNACTICVAVWSWFLCKLIFRVPLPAAWRRLPSRSGGIVSDVLTAVWRANMVALQLLLDVHVGKWLCLTWFLINVLDAQGTSPTSDTVIKARCIANCYTTVS